MEINQNLISLKWVLFVFFAGLGCLVPFLPLHMLSKGLSYDEARIISIVAPCVALLGPLLAGPLADKLAGSAEGSQKRKSGAYLRIMIAGACILAAIFYSLLLAVPQYIRSPVRAPSVTFVCDPSHGYILQEMCNTENTCHRWEEAKEGELHVSNCRHICEEALRSGGNETFSYPENEEENSDDSYDSSGYGEIEEDLNTRDKRQSEPPLYEPPHLCYVNAAGVRMCNVYTESTKMISIKVALLPGDDSVNASADDWCSYKLRDPFYCTISVDRRNLLNRSTNSCNPIIQCDVDDPYNVMTHSVLAESQCHRIMGDPDVTFWMYLAIRSIADIFPTAALVLLDAAIVIATRETSSGRGNVGIQMAWACLGFAIFAPLVGLGIMESDSNSIFYGIAIVVFAILMVVAALSVLAAREMPLSPPEWWWHTRCGMLAMPLSAIKKYGLETAALLVVVLLLGVFWSALDSYFPWHLRQLQASPLLIGLTITVGTLPALPFLWFAEKIVDYCGHTNLLIVAFTMYIVRYTGLSIVDDSPWTLLLEALEVFTLTLMWATVVMYLRHLVPRKFTVTGQALPVIAHFGFGRCIGAIIGGLIKSGSALDSLRLLYKCMAIAATIVAIVYFLLYHFIFKPRYQAPTTPPRQTPTIVQAMNGNGSYTPLRVYHNGRARKGQFRY